MRGYVLLRHDLPDGSWHYDWLMEPGDGQGEPDDRVLIAFRVVRPPHLAEAESFEALKLPDHRRLYLTFEGELSGGMRGRVRRVVEGSCRIHVSDPSRLEVTLETAGESLTLVGTPVAPVEPNPAGAELTPWKFSPRRVH